MLDNIPANVNGLDENHVQDHEPEDEEPADDEMTERLIELNSKFWFPLQFF